MIVTKQAVVEKFTAHRQHQITLPQLVDWAENAMMDTNFDEKDAAGAIQYFQCTCRRRN